MFARVHHVPQAVIAFENNVFVHAGSLDAPLVRPDFDSMRARENWDHSGYDCVMIRSATPNRVKSGLVFCRVTTFDVALLHQN